MGSFLLPGTCEHRSSNQGLLFSWPLEIQGRKVRWAAHLNCTTLFLEPSETRTHIQRQTRQTNRHPHKTWAQILFIPPRDWKTLFYLRTMAKHPLGTGSEPSLWLCGARTNTPVSHRRPAVCHLRIWPGMWQVQAAQERPARSRSCGSIRPFLRAFCSRRSAFAAFFLRRFWRRLS